MRIMARRTALLLVLCVLFTLATGLFLARYAVDADRWAVYPYNKHLYASGKLKQSGQILDRDGIVFYQTVDGQISYNPDSGVRRAALHLTGDGRGNIATSLPVAMGDRLTGWNALTGVYRYTSQRPDLRTTLDAGLCRTALNALGSYKGAVGVVNYQTGQLLCMVSTPTFDPQSPPQLSGSPDKYEGVYLNRLLSATYTPGSIFKVLTLEAALDGLPGVQARTFTCTGRLELTGGDITCPKAHGTLSLTEALVRSCNCTFAQLTLELGADALLACAQKAGLTQAASVNGIGCASGALASEHPNEALLGWTGVGQGETLVNPMSYLMYMAAIAHGGRSVEPHLLEGPTVSAGRVLSAATAGEIATMMRACVTENYGEHGLSGYGLCAKSGTAQVGSGTSHAWFTGFLQSEEAPYAFIVIAEQGGAGSQTAAAIAEAVLKHAVKLEP